MGQRNVKLKQLKENNMKKLFLNLKQSSELQKLGFNEPCFGWYENNELVTLSDCINPEDRIEFIKEGEISKRILAPMFSQAFNFFREKYDFYVTIHSSLNPDFFPIIRTSKAQYHIGNFNSYEEAESGCLDKLIELAKTK